MASVVGFALGLRCSSAALPGRDVVAFSEFLGRAASASVEAKTLRWEPSRGLLADLFMGRWLLFLAHPDSRGERDVFRARVELTHEGQPLRVAAVKNLTNTPMGDEAGLELHGRRAVFVAFSDDRAEGVTLLDFNGARVEDLPGGWLNRWLLRVRGMQEHGSLLGISKTHVQFAPSPNAELTLSASRLRVSRGGAETLEIDTRERRLLTPEASAQLIREPQGGGYWLHTLADLMREEMGAYLFSRLARAVFGAGHALRNARHAWFGGEASLAEAPRVADGAPATEGAWPPAPVTPLFERALPSEGIWRVPETPWTGGQGAEPEFVKTFLRPDPEKPYVKLWLIAMDMRRLELRMEAGYEDPKPKQGLPGRGSLPRDRDLFPRVRASFNGAFKSLHGDYGMVVERRVLVAPVPNAASVVLTEEGETGFGIWPDSTRVPEGIVSLRQNLEPLILSGELNPNRRTEWGEHLIAEGVFTQRSALCLAENGHVYYGFGESLSAESLAQGLRRAGCVFALHLDMNPGHCGFFLHHQGGTELEDIEGVSAFEGIEMLPTRFLRWSSKDFFYVVSRGSRADDEEWLPSPGEQPHPEWWPAITRGKSTIGSLEVDLWRVAPGRVVLDLVAGDDEPLGEGRPAPKRHLKGDKPPLFALNLGHTTRATRYGLAFQAEATLPLRRVYATLVLSGDRASIVPPGVDVSLGEGEVAAQLPELMVDGVPTSRTSERGALRERGALCVPKEGGLLIARAVHDSSDVLALALNRRGCRDVLELDRGSQHPAFLLRSGTNESPKARYPTTVLVGAAQPMRPKTFQWGEDGMSATSP